MTLDEGTYCVPSAVRWLDAAGTICRLVLLLYAEDDILFFWNASSFLNILPFLFFFQFFFQFSLR